MTLQDIIDEMQKEIDNIKSIINDSNIVEESELEARRMTISKYLSHLKKLNGEDLKRDEKPYCAISDSNLRPCSKRFVRCFSCEYFIAQKWFL